MNRCAICGCTDLTPCVDPWDGEPHPCAWIEDDLCSACRYTPVDVAPFEHGYRPPAYLGLVIAPTGALLVALDAIAAPP